MWTQLFLFFFSLQHTGETWICLSQSGHWNVLAWCCCDQAYVLSSNPHLPPWFLKLPFCSQEAVLICTDFQQLPPGKAPEACTCNHPPAGTGLVQGSSLRSSLCLKTLGPTEPIFQCIWLSSQTLFTWRASSVIHPVMGGAFAKRIFYTNREFLRDALNSIPG